jgi:hypothetical protein
VATQLEATEVNSNRRKRYLWDEWLNGAVWEGKSVRAGGDDWVCKDSSFISQLYKAAYERGLLVHVTPKGNGVVEWRAYSKDKSNDAEDSNVA